MQKIILKLRESATVTKYTGSGTSARIYYGHLLTIVDYVLPAVTIDVLLSPGREASPCNLDLINLDISVWMNAVGKNANTWDDVMDCFSGIIETLHRQILSDETLNLKVIGMTSTGDGPQNQGQDGVMQYPSQWQALVEAVTI